MILRKEDIEHKICFVILSKNSFGTFFFLWRIQRNIDINIFSSLSNVTVTLLRF